MTVFGYVRVSTERQVDEGVSLEEQIRRIEGRALEQGWQIAEVFIERGISGSIPLGDRPEGARLMATLQSRDVVIAAKLDRMLMRLAAAYLDDEVGLHLLQQADVLAKQQDALGWRLRIASNIAERHLVRGRGGNARRAVARRADR